MPLIADKLTRRLMENAKWVRDQELGPGIFLPLKTVNELNDHSTFWNRKKRANEQRAAIARAMHGKSKALPGSVRLCRYSPGLLDPHDGLPSSMKFVVDALAKFFGIDDGPGCPVRWEYEQEKAKFHGVRVRFFEAD